MAEREIIMGLLGNLFKKKEEMIEAFDSNGNKIMKIEKKRKIKMYFDCVQSRGRGKRAERLC